jgi:hypothetical protein
MIPHLHAFDFSVFFFFFFFIHVSSFTSPFFYQIFSEGNLFGLRATWNIESEYKAYGAGDGSRRKEGLGVFILIPPFIFDFQQHSWSSKRWWCEEGVQQGEHRCATGFRRWKFGPFFAHLFYTATYTHRRIHIRTHMHRGGDTHWLS